MVQACLFIFFFWLHEYIGNFFQDKSSDVRKAAETCIAEILRVSAQETVSAQGSSGTYFDSLVIWLAHECFV